MSDLSHDDLAARLDAGNQRFAAIDGKLSEIADLLKPLPQMQTDIAATKDIVEAWSTAKNVARFIKWASGIVAAFGILWVAVKAAARGWF